ncbi:MAG TPA: hypothetical protein VHF89_16390, partial [Solirubrobacteraceae bacterium]|nr:hypothetical protein [Solirubrobacteraceae bacterium]
AGGVTLRRAVAADREAVARLAALDSAAPPAGAVLLAEVDGEPWAALSVDDRRAVADPFRRSDGLVALLRARAEHVDPRSQGRPILAPRWAA